MSSPFHQVVASYHRSYDRPIFRHVLFSLLGTVARDSADVRAHGFPAAEVDAVGIHIGNVVFAQTGSGQAEIERLAERHRLLYVKPAHYELWLDALCEALAKNDSGFNDTLERMWRDSMRKRDCPNDRASLKLDLRTTNQTSTRQLAIRASVCSV